jgi:hypothetical protein
VFRGSPQDSPLSPLLANIYMRRFLLGWKRLGHDRRLDAHIVNYANDFVICCRRTSAEALAATRAMMSKLKLTVNETKTRLCRVGAETFDFLGYSGTGNRKGRQQARPHLNRRATPRFYFFFFLSPPAKMPPNLD